MSENDRSKTESSPFFLYNGEQENTTTRPQLRAQHLQVSDNVSEIPDHFCNSDVPIHLNLSEACNLQVIGKSAFQCALLKKIEWPTTTTRTDVGGDDEEEKACDDSLSPKLQDIRQEAFAFCCSLEELDLSTLHHLTSIGSASYAFCSAMKTIKMAPNLCHIGERAFSGCKALRDIDWNGMPLNELQADLFVKCSSLTSLDLSHLTELRTIGPRVFKDCTGLEFVKFPSTLESIGMGAFYGCESLKQVQFASHCTAPSKRLEIEQGAFAQCTSLTFFELPEYVTRLAPLTFWGCINLEKVIFQPTLESIGGSALGNCVALKEVTLPSTMNEESIGPNAFFKCPNAHGTDVWSWHYPRHENDYDENVFQDGKRLPANVTKLKIVASKRWVPSCLSFDHPNGTDALEWVDLQGDDLLHAIQLSIMYPKATAQTLPVNRLIRMYNAAPTCRSDFKAAIDERRSHFFSNAFRLILYEMREDEEKNDIMRKFVEIQLAHANTIHQLVSRRVHLDLPFEPFAFFCEWGIKG